MFCSTCFVQFLSLGSMENHQGENKWIMLGKPKVLFCMKCNRFSGMTDSFMPTCCGKKLLCYDCYKRHGKNVYCASCKQITRPTRISGEFFRDIYETITLGMNEKVRSQGQQETDGRGKRVWRNWTLHNAIYEEVWLEEGTLAKTMSNNVYKFLKEYNHRNCRLYHNLGYLCDSVCKLRQKNGERPGWVTIHDVLAFYCGFCGHGSVNKALHSNGDVLNLGNHTMGECSKACCGVFLDRRTLQFEGGECECGLEVMRMLGIRAATQMEHRWRWRLYVINPPPVRKKELGIMLNSYMSRMNIQKPFMIIWYLLSRGDEIVGELRCMAKDELEGYLWKVIDDLSKEFQVHRPIR